MRIAIADAGHTVPSSFPVKDPVNLSLIWWELWKHRVLLPKQYTGTRRSLAIMHHNSTIIGGSDSLKHRDCAVHVESFSMVTMSPLKGRQVLIGLPRALTLIAQF